MMNSNNTSPIPPAPELLTPAALTDALRFLEVVADPAKYQALCNQLEAKFAAARESIEKARTDAVSAIAAERAQLDATVAQATAAAVGTLREREAQVTKREQSAKKVQAEAEALRDEFQAKVNRITAATSAFSDQR